MPPPPDPSQAQVPLAEGGWTPLLDRLPVAAFLAGEDGRWLQVNDAAARTLGLDRETLLGGNVLDPRTRMLSEAGAVLLPEDTPTVRALRTGTSQASRLLGWIRPDGRTQWLQVSAEPVPGAGVLTVLEDVTGRRATEAVLAARNRIVELAVHGTLAEILTATLDEAERLTGSCIGFYHFVDPDQTSLTLQAWSTRTSRDFCRAEGAGLHYPLAEAGVWTEAVQARAPVIHNDYASLPNRRGMPPGHAEVLRELVVPVFRGGDLVAILGVGNKPFDYVEQDIDLIQHLAELAWDVAERRRAEAALGSSEERFRTLFERMNEGYAHCRMTFEGEDPVDWVYLAVNPAFETLTGLRQVTGRRVSEVLPGIRAAVPDLFEACGRVARLGVPERFESFIGPLGIWLSVSAFSPGPDEFVATFENISGRRAAQEALAAQEARLRSMLATAMDGIWLVGEDLRIVEVNGTACQMLGRVREEMVGRPVTDFEAGTEDGGANAGEFHRHLEDIIRVGSGRMETLHRASDGRRIPVEASITHLPESRQFVAYLRDLSGRREAEARAARWEQTFSRAGLPLLHADPATERILEVNRAFAEARGYRPEEMAGMNLGDLFPPDERRRVEDLLRSLQDLGHARFEGRHLRRDGSEFPVLVDVTIIQDREGRPVSRVACALDISERVRAEGALREAEERWHTMIEQAGDGFELTDEEGRLVDVNEASCRRSGYSREELLGMTLFQLDQELDPAFYRANFPGPLEGGPVRLERTHRAKDGSIYPVEVSFSGVRIAGKYRSLSLVRDITARRKAEAALRTSEARLRDAQDLARIGHWVQDHHTGEVVWSEALFRVHGLDPADGPPDWARFQGLIHPEDRERVAAGFASALLPGTPAYTAEYRILAPDGVLRHLRVHIRTEFDADGRAAFSFGTDQDISEQVAAREALQESEWRLAALMANLPGMVYRCANTPDWPMEFCSEGALALTGHSPTELITNQPAFGDLILPEDQDLVWQGVQSGLREGRAYELNYRIRTASGEVRWVWERGGGVKDREGRLRYLEGFIADVTERRRAEEQRQALEQQVARTQKMESLGSLAGGVAHDMNNVLGAILALASLHEKQVPDGTPLHRSMETISKACIRGRSLVQGLLGFARQGLAEERVLDLNELIREQAALLSRTTLQRVRLELDLAEDLRPVLGDPAALSHALMNLAVNAVDAMPGGGLLRLRTRNLGVDRVELAVQDTGEGMTAEVLARATDPFYTTKPQGQGTGLGLAIVYGAMKAHHGRLDLESSPGRGTTATLTFPVCDPAAVGPAPAPAPASPGGGLRVLVVDDDELLQASLASLLEAMGHRQATVGSGEEALRLLREGQPFDVVILDINMPGLGGVATLPQLRALRPELKVLVSTGRPTQEVLDLVERTPGAALLPKPFGVEDLRRQLGGPAGT